MTPAQVITAALTRNLDAAHIKQGDVDQAKSMYVAAYIDPVPAESSTFFTTYCSPVVAYGTIVNVWHRIATEVTDRGVVQMLSQGATQNNDASMRALAEHRETLNRYIDAMVVAAASESSITSIVDNGNPVLMQAENYTYNAL
jgi:hypothetical protein